MARHGLHSVHPGVVTVLQLPDEIVHTWIDHHGEIRVARKGEKLYIRPRPGTPAGVEASLEVETRTARWTFQLRVVAHARDARRHIWVPLVDSPAEESTPEAPPEEPAEPETPSLAVAPKEAPTASDLPDAASPASPEPVASPARAEPSAEHAPAANAERATATTRVSRFDLAVHAVGGLGFTGANVAKYESLIALQRHQSLGLRLTAGPPDSWWAVQANVNAEWPAGPMVFKTGPASTLEMSGSRLRWEVGTRASIGTEWTVSVYAGLGIQAHLRRIEETNSAPKTTLEQGAVLSLGMGLQYQTRGKVLLGLDFLSRQGGLDDYHSVEALLIVGRSLGQGD